MALRVQTQITGDVFIFLCNGRIVFGDEGAALRERVGNMLPGTPKIVVNLKGVDYIDSGGLGILVGLLVSARNRGGELKLVSPRKPAAATGSSFVSPLSGTSHASRASQAA
jgi:anti-sigma B factor antagonist